MERLQEQFNQQQSELATLRSSHGQLARQLQEQEVKKNEEMVVFLRTVNCQAVKIRSLHGQVQQHPSDVQAMQRPQPT